jgi:prophage DNA circulation protein
MPAFDELQLTSFAGIEFAVSDLSVKGGIREHVHEYPGAPGGQPEKMGRKLYTIEVTATFSTNSPYYPGAFPDSLNALRLLFEQEVTDKLVIPHIGTIDAYAVDWEEALDMRRMRDGAKTKFVFREDSQNLTLVESLVVVGYTSIKTMIEAVRDAMDDAGMEEDDLFESMDELANDFQAVGDQVELAGNQVSSKIDSVKSNIDKIDATVSQLSDPEGWPVVRALHDLGNVLISLRKDTMRKARPIKSYTTPKEMTVLDVARAVYGDQSRALEVLMLNPIADAFAIPDGTRLQVYADAA